MTLREEILALLESTSSQKPMAMGELMGKSGVSHEPMRELLDELYAQHVINRARVITDGIEREVFWLTGATASITHGRYVPPPCP